MQICSNGLDNSLLVNFLEWNVVTVFTTSQLNTMRPSSFIVALQYREDKSPFVSLQADNDKDDIVLSLRHLVNANVPRINKLLYVLINNLG